MPKKLLKIFEIKKQNKTKQKKLESMTVINVSFIGQKSYPLLQCTSYAKCRKMTVFWSEKIGMIATQEAISSH